jgi:hypothetical protein
MQGPMRPMFADYDHWGLLGNARTLRAILEREPRTLRSYFAELSNEKRKELEMSGDSPIPPDDPARKLSIVDPDDADLQRVAVVGDTYPTRVYVPSN